jgi:hypothetical protein
MGFRVSALVDRAIDSAGLGEVLGARRDGALGDAELTRLREADLLVLGALADRVRAHEVGPEVRIHVREPPADVPADFTFPDPGRNLTGLELLREIAIARVTGPFRACVRVDWVRCGMELAQVALGFGANELVGTIATKRGLPIADGELVGSGKKSRRESAQTAKLKELAGCIRRAARRPVVVGHEHEVEFMDGASPIQEKTG